MNPSELWNIIRITFNGSCSPLDNTAYSLIANVETNLTSQTLTYLARTGKYVFVGP